VEQFDQTALIQEAAMPSFLARMWPRVSKYIEVTKPSTVALLVFTSLGGMVLAGGLERLSPIRWLVALVAITAGCAGANTLTCYIDRDIDALMDRTRRRPLPGRRIHPPEKAVVWGLFLTALAVMLSATLNTVALLWMAVGLFDNVVIYSLLTKRSTCTNILLGSISGGMPAMFGWAAVRGDVTWTPVLLGLLVILWTPNHIWNLAIRYREDYARAGVPMLPVVSNLSTTIRAIVISVVLMVAGSLALGPLAGLGVVYLGLAVIGGLAALVGHAYLWVRPTERNAWLMFKLSSLYLALIFGGMMLDYLLSFLSK